MHERVTIIHIPPQSERYLRLLPHLMSRRLRPVNLAYHTAQALDRTEAFLKNHVMERPLIRQGIRLELLYKRQVAPRVLSVKNWIQQRGR